MDFIQAFLLAVFIRLSTGCETCAILKERGINFICLIETSLDSETEPVYEVIEITKTDLDEKIGMEVIEIHTVPKFMTDDIKMDFSNCAISKIHAGALRGNELVMILNLSNNKINMINEETFGNLTYLQELYLNDNIISEISNGTFSKMLSLEVLHLQNNRLVLFAAKLPESLFELNLFNNKLHDLNIESKNLTWLNLCKNPMTHPPPDIYNLEFITVLCLGDKITEMSPSTPPWPNILNLTISAKDLKEKPFLNTEIQQIIQEFAGLQYIHLDNYKVDKFMFLNNLVNIKELKLQRVELTKEVDLPNKPYLISLNLDFSPSVAQSFLSYPPSYKALRILSLKNTEINNIETDKAKQLIKMLDKLDLRGNPLDCTPENWNWLLNILQEKPILVKYKETCFSRYLKHISEEETTEGDIYSEETYSTTEGDIYSEETYSTTEADINTEETYSTTELIETTQDDEQNELLGDEQNENLVYLLTGICILIIVVLLCITSIYYFALRQRGILKIKNSDVPPELQLEEHYNSQDEQFIESKRFEKGT